VNTSFGVKTNNPSVKLTELLLLPVFSTILDSQHQMSSTTVDVRVIVLGIADNPYFGFGTNHLSVKLAELLLLVLSAVLFFGSRWC
jgi:hypothetical protein